jgi:hypothetical protein
MFTETYSFPWLTPKIFFKNIKNIAHFQELCGTKYCYLMQGMFFAYMCCLLSENDKQKQEAII